MENIRSASVLKQQTLPGGWEHSGTLARKCRSVFLEAGCHFSRTKGDDVSFLRKQPSRLVPAQTGILVYSFAGENQGNMDFSVFLDSRLSGNATLDLVRQENDRLLASAKMLPFF